MVKKELGRWTDLLFRPDFCRFRPTSWVGPISIRQRFRSFDEQRSGFLCPARLMRPFISPSCFEQMVDWHASVLFGRNTDAISSWGINNCPHPGFTPLGARSASTLVVSRPAQRSMAIIRLRRIGSPVANSDLSSRRLRSAYGDFLPASLRSAAGGPAGVTQLPGKNFTC